MSVKNCYKIFISNFLAKIFHCKIRKLELHVLIIASKCKCDTKSCVCSEIELHNDEVIFWVFFIERYLLNNNWYMQVHTQVCTSKQLIMNEKMCFVCRRSSSCVLW